MTEDIDQTQFHSEHRDDQPAKAAKRPWKTPKCILASAAFAETSNVAASDGPTFSHS